jgi:hypothetical protein
MTVDTPRTPRLEARMPLSIYGDSLERLLGKLDEITGRLVEYDPEHIVETLTAGSCRHRLPRCRSYERCLDRSDVQRPAKRIYFNQTWMTLERCRVCRHPLESTVYAYEKLPRSRGRGGLITNEVLVVPCARCNHVLLAYQPVRPLHERVAFPNLLLLRPRELMWIGLKLAKGKVTPERLKGLILWGKDGTGKKRNPIMTRRLEDYDDGDTIQQEEFFRLIGEEPPALPVRPRPRKHEEADFQRQVQEMSRLHGWLDWHVLKSKGMRAGFPDLLLIRPPKLIWVELKSAKGKLTQAQAEMHEMLRDCGHTVFVWFDTPETWNEIEEILKKGRDA